MQAATIYGTKNTVSFGTILGKCNAKYGRMKEKKKKKSIAGRGEKINSQPEIRVIFFSLAQIT